MKKAARINKHNIHMPHNTLHIVSGIYMYTANYINGIVPYIQQSHVSCYETEKKKRCSTCSRLMHSNLASSVHRFGYHGTLIILHLFPKNWAQKKTTRTQNTTQKDRNNWWEESFRFVFPSLDGQCCGWCREKLATAYLMEAKNSVLSICLFFLKYLGCLLLFHARARMCVCVWSFRCAFIFLVWLLFCDCHECWLEYMRRSLGTEKWSQLERTQWFRHIWAIVSAYFCVYIDANFFTI